MIGPGGEAANRVRRIAKCQLHVRRAVVAGDLQIVELKGNEAQVSGRRGEYMRQGQPRGMGRDVSHINIITEYSPDLLQRGEILILKTVFCYDTFTLPSSNPVPHALSFTPCPSLPLPDAAVRSWCGGGARHHPGAAPRP